jgi:carboxyl-terminal processing protease
MPRRHLTWLLIYSVVALLCAARGAQLRAVVGYAEVMALIQRDYVEETDQRELYNAGLQGMVSTLDPYSAYLPPVDATAVQQHLDAEFGGIGAEVGADPETRQIIIMSPLIDTPAYRAGIQAKDRLLAIDGEPTEGQSVRDVVDKIRGRIGTPVKLTLRSIDSAEPREVEVVRDRIHVDTVLGDTRDDDHRWIYLLPSAPDVAYIQCHQFSTGVSQELQAAIEEAKAQGMRALVLDFRDNAGGLLDEAVAMCDLFLDAGVIVTTRRRNMPDEVFMATPGEIIPKMPIAVLINGNTASAAEIVAACLQDHGRATVFGTRSFGKGSVQDFTELADGGALKLTVGSYWRPSNRNIHRKPDAKPEDEWGVSPDAQHVIPVSDEQQIAMFRFWRDRRIVRPMGMAPDDSRLPTEVDPQLRAAVAWLEQKLDPEAFQPMSTVPGETVSASE